MSRSLSWIDPAALSAALEKAGVKPGRGSAPAAAATKFATPRPATPQPTMARVPPLIAPPSGGADPDDDFRPPAGGLEERLEALLAWVAGATGCRSIFVLDEEGLVLIEEQSDPTLVALSSSFINYHDRVRSSLGSRSQGSITIDVEAGQILHMLQVVTGLGRYVLGFVAAEPVPRLRIRKFQTALGRALEPQ